MLVASDDSTYAAHADTLQPKPARTVLLRLTQDMVSRVGNNTTLSRESKVQRWMHFGNSVNGGFAIDTVMGKQDQVGAQVSKDTLAVNADDRRLQLHFVRVMSLPDRELQEEFNIAKMCISPMASFAQRRNVNERGACRWG